jgi:hypothetical protein
VGRVDHVDVEREIYGSREPGSVSAHPASHIDGLDVQARRLFALMLRRSAYAYLHQPRDQPTLGDPRECAGMREAVPLELVVEIRMGVELQHREPRV